MIARYDSEARSLAIQLQPDAIQDATVEPAANVIVGLRGEVPVEVEVIRCDIVGLDGLDIVAGRYAIDAQALHAAADAALAAADRTVMVDVAAAA